MEEILKKLFDKYFRYKIRKDWSENIQGRKFTEQQEKELAKEIASAVIDCIEDAILVVKRELDQQYWLIDTTIQDSIDRIEDDIIEQKMMEEQEIESETWTSENSPIEPGTPAICNYKYREGCSCIHNKVHAYDPASCAYECAYDDGSLPTDRACCVPAEKEEIENEDKTSEDLEKEILETGGV